MGIFVDLSFFFEFLVWDFGGGGGPVVEVVFSKRKFKFLGKVDEKNWIFLREKNI